MHCPYTTEKAKLVVREMDDLLVLLPEICMNFFYLLKVLHLIV